MLLCRASMIAKYFSTLAVTVAALTLVAASQIRHQLPVFSGNALNESLKWEFTIDENEIDADTAQFLKPTWGSQPKARHTLCPRASKSRPSRCRGPRTAKQLPNPARP